MAAGPDAPPLGSGWPLTIPAVSQVLTNGLELPAGVTLLIGENGSGKSTLVEAIAMAYGLSPEGGSIHARHSTYRTESDLHGWLQLERSPGAKKWGFFLRAETMHGFYSYLKANPPTGPVEDRTSTRSATASPSSRCCGRASTRRASTASTSRSRGCRSPRRSRWSARSPSSPTVAAQVLCATHSPLLAAIPGANVLEVGPWGLRAAAYGDLEVVGHWRAYLADPMRYLRHVL